MYTLSFITVLLFLSMFVSSKCKDESDSLNSNLFDSKNIINNNGNNVLQKLLIESKFSSDILKNFDKNKNTDAVNNYEDITVLDKNGQLKNLKFKTAKIPVTNKIHYQLVTKVGSKSTNVRDKLTSPVKVAIGDKVIDKVIIDSQVEKPATNRDKVKSGSNGLKSKFFDELGCKYFYKHFNCSLQCRTLRSRSIISFSILF